MRTRCAQHTLEDPNLMISTFVKAAPYQQACNPTSGLQEVCWTDPPTGSWLVEERHRSPSGLNGRYHPIYAITAGKNYTWIYACLYGAMAACFGCGAFVF